MASSDNFEFVETCYGKNNVKLLHVRRAGKDGSFHHIREIEVNTELHLDSREDYLCGDNRYVVPTDTQKNTVYVLAKQLGVTTIEKFAMQLANHFLTKYCHVNRVNIHIEQYPWKRINTDGRPHRHAFIFSPDSTRFCDVTQQRHGRPLVSAGLKDLRVLKTTQSAFVNFHKCEYTTLPEATDRVFSTTVESRWWYDTTDGVDFDTSWDTVKMCILDLFAGPPETGLFSSSVQQTLCLTGKLILSKIPQISKIEMVMPNKHYHSFDLSKFKSVGFEKENNEVFLPVDKPAGNIKAVLARTQTSKL